MVHACPKKINHGPISNNNNNKFACLPKKKKKAINLLLFFGTYACEIVSLVLVAFALIPICGAQFFNLRIRIHLILVVWTLDYKHRMVIFLFFINVKLIMPTAWYLWDKMFSYRLKRKTKNYINMVNFREQLFVYYV